MQSPSSASWCVQKSHHISLLVLIVLYKHARLQEESLVQTTMLLAFIRRGFCTLVLFIEASAVSGANDYLSLCVAAKAEEKRLAELRKRRQYHSDQKQKPLTTARTEVGPKQSQAITAAAQHRNELHKSSAIAAS